MLLAKDIPALLEDRANRYNRPDFIKDDPIQIPHRYSRKEDIEIAAFLTATIAWGQRVTILNNASRLCEWMGESPVDFLLHYRESDLKPFQSFVHRTFNGDDALFFVHRLARLYRHEYGLEGLFSAGFHAEGNIKTAITIAHEHFFSEPHLPRTRKHFSDPSRGSAAKRLNMFLRWMVRRDDQGVDFGIWNQIPSSALKVPLDVHTGTVARSLGILHRKQNDWKAVEELTDYLKTLDPNDPVKYDFALFGMGASRDIPALI